MTSPKFEWSDGDVVIEPRRWSFTYIADETEYLVRRIEDLFLYVRFEFPDRDPNDAIEEWIAKLTADDVTNMPDELRDDLLDGGYKLP